MMGRRRCMHCCIMCKKDFACDECKLNAPNQEEFFWCSVKCKEDFYMKYMRSTGMKCELIDKRQRKKLFRELPMLDANGGAS